MNRHIGICALASGSKGNSILVDGPEGALLVDAGLSAREILRRLSHVGADPGRVRGILVTHDHSDHIRGVRVLARRLGVPVYGTGSAVKAAVAPESLPASFVKPGGKLEVAGFTVLPFSLPHDAEDPVGYVLGLDGIRIGIATDLGCRTALLMERMAGCDVLVLESNHCEKLLMEGPYPWFLKQRIRSRTGHLSNEASGSILTDLVHDGLQHVILAHLSEINNTPDLALGSAAEAVAAGRNGVALTVAGMAVPTCVVKLEL
ncbi:MAG: MBL fold metallo-hydrolase [bacterium]|nr:MAG: MBL fold metallo-hydrolase [bacterium]